LQILTGHLSTTQYRRQDEDMSSPIMGIGMGIPDKMDELDGRPGYKRPNSLARSTASSRRWTFTEATEHVARLNRKLAGWAYYFCLGPVSKAYRIVDTHTRYRLRQWLCTKHKVPGQGTSRFPDKYLDQRLGLVKLQVRTRNFPWAKA